MPITIPYPPSFLQRHWRLVLAAVIFLLLAGLALYGLNRAWARTGDMETLSQASQIRSGLNLYYYYHRDFPPANGLLKSVNLGEGEAICLDRSEAGLNNFCSRDVILSVLPQGFQYQKAALGDYNLAFVLKRSIAGFKDINKDGKIVCLANAQNLVCR
ncbi:MAG: hypothetical protein Q8M83_04650 [bacterium]|nr:hypothetical protein [bacterium]